MPGAISVGLCREVLAVSTDTVFVLFDVFLHRVCTDSV